MRIWGCCAVFPGFLSIIKQSYLKT
jgi:hypothetical protein